MFTGGGLLRQAPTFRAAASFLTPMFRSTARKITPPMARVAFPGTASKASPRLMLYLGFTSAGILLPNFKRPVIHNDSILSTLDPSYSRSDLTTTRPVPVTRERFNGKLNYRQLCMGSITGLAFGIIMGKISHALVFVSAFGLLALQWLQSRGIVNKDATKGLSKYVLNMSREQVDLNTLIWEKPSFKVSFLLSFVLAAMNI
ncbi:HBL076Cp [Eremothecium sinecaudum]|uniref:HBL076Cp n=1 Tax=Eremothecium sinecaudum TaxID=45286 RepID=A0A120K0Z7_9SACH|nr:HBL076Cp [Eremothecium sinecaudum]AMD18826.1 HBL076Cp [Eremothecium sinecaudum]